MSWQDYFECKIRTIYDITYTHYEYKDKSITMLPDNLPMPPTDTFYRMFRDCKELQDITALSRWDVSTIKDMTSMFWNCEQLKDITALSNWNVTNVNYMQYMFYGCHKLQDITALSNWNINKFIDVHDMFYGCQADIDLTPLLGQPDNNNESISSEPTIPVHQEFNELRMHITRLEEKIEKLTEIVKSTHY